MYGIDVATYQRNLNMQTIEDVGNEFVGVKSVSSYKPELTVAADYAHNVDKVIAVGLPKYHYAVPNTQNSPATTAKFQWDIKHGYEPRDLFMLDNEPLDAYKTFWRDDPAADYFESLHTFGVPYSKMILYCPAALTRASGPWNRIIALREKGLIIQWVSYGDMDPLYEDGEQPNTGSTGLTNPEMHQFTSSYTVPGYAGTIDRVFSRLTAQELFGGREMAFNPFANMRITGTWADHASYSAGGTDLPTGYGTVIRAPATGTLQVSGGSGEWACGWVGSAGRRSILHLNEPISRKLPRQSSPPEGEGPMVAIVFQHQSAFGSPGGHLMGADVGRTGASANGSDHGGDVHLHWHGLNARGQRLRLESFITGSSPAGGEEDDMYTDKDRERDDNIAAHLYKGGTDAAKPEYLGGKGSVYQILKSPVVRSSQSQATLLPEDGTPVSIGQVQDNADTNSLLRSLSSGGGDGDTAIDAVLLKKVVNDAVEDAIPAIAEAVANELHARSAE